MAKNWIIVTLADEGGKTVIVNKKAVRLLFETPKPGKYIVTMEGADKRSLPQNNYYWGICVKLCQIGMNDLGHDVDADEVHAFLKGRFNYVEIVNKDTGQMERVPRSTSKLTKEQFSLYIQNIQQFAAEFLNTVIPDPDATLTLNYDEQLYEGTASEGAGYEEGAGITKGAGANE